MRHFLAVSDTGNDRVSIWKGPDGEKVQNVLGGPLAPQFDFVDPRGVAVWRYGSQFDEAVVLVADPGRNQIYRSTPNGRRLDSWGSNDPTSDREGFRQPMDVTVSFDGNAFIADAGNNRIVVRGPDGGVLNTIGPFPNGPYELDRPSAVAAGPANLVYVLEDGRSRIQSYTVSGERVDEWLGADGDDAPPGRPWMPVDLAFYGDYLYVLENDRVQQGESNHVRVQVFRPLPGIPLEECLVTVFASTHCSTRCCGNNHFPVILVAGSPFSDTRV